MWKTIFALLTIAKSSSEFDENDFEFDLTPQFTLDLDGNCKDPNIGYPNYVIENDSGKNCTDFASDGYRCVPFWACDGGVIITDGRSIIGIRSGLLTLDPMTSKCHGDLETCCR